MKKIFLMGRSEAGKTSLTQALKGEELHYHKTQYTNSNDDTIDSPGEYAESKHFSVGLACFSFEADVIAIVQAANEPFNLFSDGSRILSTSSADRYYHESRLPLCEPSNGPPVDGEYGLRADLRGQQRNERRNLRTDGLPQGRPSETHLGAGEVQAEPWPERMAATSGGRGVSGEYQIKN